MGLFDLAGSVARNVREDNTPRSLVAGKFHAELINGFLGKAFELGLELNNGGANFAQTCIRQADNGNVLDGGVAVQEVLDLHGVNVLAAGNDDVLLAVNQPNEAVFVHARHIARKQPAVFEHFGGGFGVVVIAGHNAGALHPQLADSAVFHIVAVFAHNARLPTIARNANGAHMVHVANAQMHATRAGGFGQAVVRVVIVVGENLQPALNQALRNRLRTHVHKTPLV